MPRLEATRVADLLRPYVTEDSLKAETIAAVQVYLDLLLKWSARTSLTAIRNPEDLVQRQIGESLFSAQLIPAAGTLLDFGSGAGFPGIPLQIVRPQLRVMLAESQGKKASFLREAVRSLSLPCEVWAKRVEDLPAVKTFDVVILRAVDSTAAMLPLATARVKPGGLLVRFTGGGSPEELLGWRRTADFQVPGSVGRLMCWERPA